MDNCMELSIKLDRKTVFLLLERYIHHYLSHTIHFVENPKFDFNGWLRLSVNTSIESGLPLTGNYRMDTTIVDESIVVDILKEMYLGTLPTDRGLKRILTEIGVLDGKGKFIEEM